MKTMISDNEHVAADQDPGTSPVRIGVYVCHCGTNIAGKVDVEAVTRYAASLPQVAIARDYKFLCSDPGQDLIIKDIQDHHLNRVVVASCSPRMHEPTFRQVCRRADLNPFLMTMANIREQCSWVTADPNAASEKARDLIRGAVARVTNLEPLQTRVVPVHPATLVIGGGIAGIQAALELGDAGRKVILVEQQPSIGGHMAKFDKTFPTLDCSACILTPRMVSVGQNPNIELLTYSEVIEVSGYVGNFKVRVRRKARYVDEHSCNGCGACWEACPAVVVPAEREIRLGEHTLDAPNRREGQFGPVPEASRSRSLEKLREASERLRAKNATDECILCQLCVRACRDVVGASVLTLDKSAKVILAEHPERCLVCGTCAQLCPTGYLRVVPKTASPGSPEESWEIPRSGEDGDVIRHHEALLGTNTAISLPFMQAVPAVPVIDADQCIHLQSGGCGVCAEVCERRAIAFDAHDEEVEFEVGSIIVATGFQSFDPSDLTQYGYGRLKNVLTALEFEVLNNAAGPTNGRILLANGEAPESVALIHCVGSRDSAHHEYCSRVCCMVALKCAHLIQEKTGAAVYDFYLDMRCFGKGYEEFYNRLLDEGVYFIRGRAAEVSDFAIYEEERGKLVVRAEDTLIGVVRRIPVDMVVLMTGLEPGEDAEHLARVLGIPRSGDGFFMERHPKLAPVATATDGVFIAGACQGPKDIPDTVAQASAAAAAALSLSVQGKVLIEPVICTVDPDRCSGCRICNTLCPSSAITFDAEKHVSEINDAVCKGCGTCAAACPSHAIRASHFTAEQVLAEIREVCT